MNQQQTHTSLRSPSLSAAVCSDGDGALGQYRLLIERFVASPGDNDICRRSQDSNFLASWQRQIFESRETFQLREALCWLLEELATTRSPHDEAPGWKACEAVVEVLLRKFELKNYLLRSYRCDDFTPVERKKVGDHDYILFSAVLLMMFQRMGDARMLSTSLKVVDLISSSTEDRAASDPLFETLRDACDQAVSSL